MSATDIPPYGAQHRQNALWEGGNEALPPRWEQFEVLGDGPDYQDHRLLMSSSKRPLPGVRLDQPENLVVPGCEWHISPHGRSYFVNHNTRTTTWKKPTPERPVGSLTPECIIEGHSRCIQSLACLGTSCNILSASSDRSIRQATRDGKPVGKPFNVTGGAIASMAISPDETMVVSGDIYGRLRLWNIRKGSMVGDPWEGHNNQVMCLDWSSNALEIVSGSGDGTIRRWNPKTGRQIAPSIETGHGWVFAVKYSPQGDKFTSGGQDEMIRIWSRIGELLFQIEGHEDDVMSLCWSKDGAHIFSASLDRTVRKWRSINGEELVVFCNHTASIRSLCLSPDESHLVSASSDCSIRIWDLTTNQQVGNPLLHDDEIFAVTISPDGKYIVSGGLDTKIYVWSMEAALEQQGDDQGIDDTNAKPNAKFKGHPARPRDILDGRLVAKKQANTRGSARYGDDFFGNDTNHALHHAPPASPSSLIRWLDLFGPKHFGTRPANAPQQMARQPRYWNFNLFPVGISRRIVDVTPARDEDRYGITPESDAEAAAAMQRTSGNEVDGLTQPGQPAPGTQGSQALPTQTQDPTGGVSYEVNCCGLLFGCRRPTSHQS